MTHDVRGEFEIFTANLALIEDEHLLNEGPKEQARRATAALTRFHARFPLTRVRYKVLDLAGFGEVSVVFESEAEPYVLIGDVARALGMPVHAACKWARQQQSWAIEDQRRADEDRGDGLLGWDYLSSLCDLRFEFIADDPEAKPDANGRRWSSYGEWLIARTKLTQLIAISPWGEEFMNNTADHMALGFRAAFGDRVDQLQAYTADGEPSDARLFHTDLTEEEAARKAVRGPVVPDETPGERGGDG